MFRLPQHVQERFDAARDAEQSKAVVFANLNNPDLVASAKFWLAHCHQPKRFSADEPVYDATFWHVIVPELLRRIEVA